VDNVVNKTLRVKFPKEVEKILNEKVISDKKIVEMQKFIEKSKEYKSLTKVGEEYLPYLRNINRESFDYQGINSVNELKQEWHQYNVLFTKLSISVIIFFPEMVLTSNPKSIPLILAV
jgi:hypothetical protein